MGYCDIFDCIFSNRILALQVKLGDLLLPFLTSWLLLFFASCGQCLRHQACQIFDIVKQEALGILSLLDYHYFSHFQYRPTFNSTVSPQAPTCLFQVIFSHILWLPMDLSTVNLEGYVSLSVSPSIPQSLAFMKIAETFLLSGCQYWDILCLSPSQSCSFLLGDRNESSRLFLQQLYI